MACASDSHKHPIKNTSCPWFHEVPVRVGLRIRRCESGLQTLSDAHGGGSTSQALQSGRKRVLVAGEMALCLRALTALAKYPGLVPRIHVWRPTISCNSSSKGLSALVYTLRVSAVGCVHSHIQPHTHIYTQKNKISSKRDKSSSH